jgi:hypothetical protein
MVDRWDEREKEKEAQLEDAANALSDILRRGYSMLRWFEDKEEREGMRKAYRRLLDDMFDLFAQGKDERDFALFELGALVSRLRMLYNGMCLALADSTAMSVTEYQDVIKQKWIAERNRLVKEKERKEKEEKEKDGNLS